MQYRERDGLTLAIGIGLLLLGLVMCWYTTGDRDPGNLFFPRLQEPLWLNMVMGWQETWWFGALVALAGAAYLWHGAGVPMPNALRVVVVWAVLALIWDVMLYRAIGFWTARNPPWWATVWLVGITVALTIRRVADLHKVWRGRNA